MASSFPLIPKYFPLGAWFEYCGYSFSFGDFSLLDCIEVDIMKCGTLFNGMAFEVGNGQFILA